MTVERSERMPLINLVVILIVVGVLLWLVNNYIPMDSKIKTILNIVVVIGVVIWLLQALGLLGSISNIRIGHQSSSASVLNFREAPTMPWLD